MISKKVKKSRNPTHAVTSTLPSRVKRSFRAVVPCCRAPLCWEVTGGLRDITKSRKGLSGPAQTSPGEHPAEIPGLAKPGPHRFRPALALDKTLPNTKVQTTRAGVSRGSVGRNKESKAGTSVPKKMSAAGPRKAQNMTHFLKQSSATKENTENQRRRAN